MEKYVFPYGFSLSFGDGRVKTFPAIHLSLRKENSEDEFSFLVLVDSGATISVFTKSDAELLGLVLENGERCLMEGVSGERFLAFLHSVVVKIAGQQIQVRIAFSERNDTPRVLGRESIFSHFFIIFDEKGGSTIFIKREKGAFEKVLYGTN